MVTSYVLPYSSQAPNLTILAHIRKAYKEKSSITIIIMNLNLWILGVIIALLSALNTIFWGYCIRDLGDPQLQLSFLFKLVFNKWFILAMGTSFVAAVLSYAVLR